jgi:hypothetical protein
MMVIGGIVFLFTPSPTWLYLKGGYSPYDAVRIHDLLEILSYIVIGGGLVAFIIGLAIPEQKVVSPQQLATRTFCTNCGTITDTPFCPDCGQRILKNEEG